MPRRALVVLALAVAASFAGCTRPSPPAVPPPRIVLKPVRGAYPGVPTSPSPTVNDCARPDVSAPGMRQRLAAVARRGPSLGELVDVHAPVREWRWIVLHHSASEEADLASIDHYHRHGRGWDEAGYHFVIGNGSRSPDGYIEVGSRWPKQKHGAHCKVAGEPEYNELGVGICLIGNFENHRPSRAQIASARVLVDLLSHWFDIPRSHIRGHRQITHRTACPGRHFPYGEILPR